MSKKIVFKIDKQGNVKIESVEGYGDGCLDFTKFIERELGKSDEQSRKLTDEFNEPMAVNEASHISH